MMRHLVFPLAIVVTWGTTYGWSRHPDALTEEALAQRPSHQWQYAELEADTNQSMHARSFANGRQVFNVAQCNACHRMNGEGNEFGPDLETLDRQWTPTRILLHTIEPSHEINKDFRTHVFELDSGKVVSGLITAIGISSIKVVENPRETRQPTTIKVASIAQRRISRQSIMPTGLLDKLDRTEILDLVAYVYSGGDDRHTVFQTDGGDP